MEVEVPRKLNERQKELLMCLVDHADFMDEMAENVVRAFFAQDLDAIQKAMEAKLNNSCDNTPEEDAEILDKRNADWLTKMPAIMAEKPTLFAVGAAHLYGEQGVLHLLRTAGYTVEENNAVHVQDKGQFWYFDFTAVMAEDGILVTGDIILKNARGGRDSRSLTGLENAVFTAKAPFDLSQLAGTHWMRREVIKKDEKLPFDSSEITFGDGKGSIGDWFYGAASFTYTVENETVTLDFGQDGLQATAVYQDDLLILDFGYAVISYTLM